ncbi:hypothetical protein CHA_P10126 [Pseudomonas phage CHA_P1]|uniref:Uncharacterized protein n=1 Tax=Pseudomonas phage CHA_P1 TaxID=1327965 RepID=V5JVS6_9CAUD|nr:hypothetical protein X837_gp126 [Pseudomonas phage CHA_P1]AGR89080.1 hypothetical protein CHA_P10126 [Pseudomonas phage CHA_P1]
MENLNETLGAVCQKCGNTGQADSGGVQSWGEPISIPCDCTAEQEEFLAWACQEYGVEDSEELNENHRDIRENKKGWMAHAASLKRSKFRQHLDKCADDVATWPSYKREVLTQPCSTKAEQAGGDERVIGWRERILAAHPNSDPGFWPDALLVEHMAAEIADLRAALARVAELKTMADNYCALLMDANTKLAELEKKEPLLHINPLVVDELLGRAKRSPGGLTWSKERCGSWTLPLYVAPVAQAQYIVPDDVEAFLDEVRTELLRARSKFPGDRIMTIALAEEFGELCKAVLDEPAANVRKEAVQTAVMAARIVLDGDGSVTSWRSERGLDPLAGATGKED